MWSAVFYALLNEQKRVRTMLRNHVMPLGAVLQFAGTAPPSGWTVCNGAALNAVANPQYLPLFNFIGTQHGGTGSNDFRLPDLRNRFVVGTGSDYGLADTGGAKEIALTVNEMPIHDHPIDGVGDHQHTATLFGAGDDTGANYDAFGALQNGAQNMPQRSANTNNAGGHNHTIHSVGGGQPFDNRPPFYAITYIIRTL